MRGRYDIQVEGGITLSLRPQNLTQLCSVEVDGLEHKPELNGRTGQIVGYDEQRGRYMVVMDGSAMSVALQPGNCILKPGTQVVLQGLSNQVFNGQMGVIVKVDRSAGRFTVQCETGKQINVKYDNVLC